MYANINGVFIFKVDHFIAASCLLEGSRYCVMVYLKERDIEFIFEDKADAELFVAKIYAEVNIDLRSCK